MISKVRFIEPGNRILYKRSLVNFFIVGKTIKNPSNGPITLATIVKKQIDDTLVYSESFSKIDFEDV